MARVHGAEMKRRSSHELSGLVADPRKTRHERKRAGTVEHVYRGSVKPLMLDFCWVAYDGVTRCQIRCKELPHEQSKSP